MSYLDGGGGRFCWSLITIAAVVSIRQVQSSSVVTRASWGRLLLLFQLLSISKPLEHGDLKLLWWCLHDMSLPNISTGVFVFWFNFHFRTSIHLHWLCSTVADSIADSIDGLETVHIIIDGECSAESSSHGVWCFGGGLYSNRWGPDNNIFLLSWMDEIFNYLIVQWSILGTWSTWLIQMNDTIAKQNNLL